LKGIERERERHREKRKKEKSSSPFLLLLLPQKKKKKNSLRTFLNAASSSPRTATHYEFMQDYTVHIKHEAGKDLYERIPYFSLPANGAKKLCSFF
jgi:hypothetical protein